MSVVCVITPLEVYSVIVQILCAFQRFNPNNKSAVPPLRRAALSQPPPGRPEQKDALVGPGDPQSPGDLGRRHRPAHPEGLPEEPPRVRVHL